MADKLVHEIAIVIEIGWRGLGSGVGWASPCRRPVQAGNDSQAMGAIEVHNLVELGPTAVAAHQLDILPFALGFDLGPGELLLGPPQAGLLGHLDRPFSLPGLHLAGQEEIGAVGIDIGVGDRANGDPGSSQWTPQGRVTGQGNDEQSRKGQQDRQQQQGSQPQRRHR